jgi:hypothetical protein
VRGSAPEEAHEAGGEEQGDEEAEPEAGGSHFAVEAEVDGERHAYEPVGGELGEEGSGGVACAAQGTGGGDLDAVEELEAGGDEEQGGGGGDDAGVGGEEAGDLGGDGEQDERGDEHEGGASGDAGPAGGGGVGEGGSADLDTADGVADADGGGRGDRERDHEGGGGALQGDLVAGEREAAKGGNKGGDGGEDGDFDEDSCAGGGAENEELAEMLEFDYAGDFVTQHGADAVVMAAVEPPEGTGVGGEHVEASEAGGPGRAGDAEGGDGEGVAGEVPAVAEDEEPVSGDVDQVGGDETEGDGAGVVGGLEITAKGKGEEQGEGAVVQAGDGGDGAVEDGVVDREMEQEGGSEGEEADE